MMRGINIVFAAQHYCITYVSLLHVCLHDDCLGSSGALS